MQHKSRQLQTRVKAGLALSVFGLSLLVLPLMVFLTTRVSAAAASVDMFTRGTDITTSKVSDYDLISCSPTYVSDPTGRANVELEANFAKWVPYGQRELETIINSTSYQQAKAALDTSFFMNQLNESEYNYVKGNYNKTIPVITFKATPNGTYPEKKKKCSDLYLIPVSPTKWVGFQMGGDENSLGTNGLYIDPIIFVSTTPNNPTEGDLSYGTRQKNSSGKDVYARPTVRVGIAGSTIPPTPPPVGGGGPTSTTGTWVDAATIRVGNEEFRKYSWDNKPFYYLTTTSDTARTKDQVYGTAKTKPTDPIATVDGKPAIDVNNCMPFLYVKNGGNDFISIPGTSPKDFQKLQTSINSLGQMQFEYYDYNTNCSRKDVAALSITNPTSNEAKTWFYYGPTENKYVSVFIDGAGDEAPYIKGVTYTQPSGAAFYKGGVVCGENRIIQQPPGTKPLTGTISPVTWELRKNEADCQHFITPSLTMYALASDDSFNKILQQYSNKALPDEGVDAPSCDTSIVNPITWVVCPIYSAAVTFVQQFDKVITSQLVLPVTAYFGDGKCADLQPPTGEASGGACASARGVRTAWSFMRNIALSGLVIVGLVMVISQAFSVGPFDSYSVKKLLPRLVIATIAISLSWQWLELAIRISNVVGLGIGALIEAPFSSIPNGQISGATTTVVGLFGTAGFLAMGVMGILSFALTAALATIIAFGTLVFRQILVMALVIAAPIAILCSILPGTRKGWEFWEDSFKGVLLVFPIITGFIAIGHAFSRVAINMDNTGNSLVVQAIAIIAYFLPYFLLPAAFKVASGIFSTITGSLNDRSKGGFDRLSKYRKKSGAQHRERQGRRVLGKRADWQNRLQNQASKDSYGRSGRFAIGLLSKGVGGYNVQAADSARRAAVGKEINDQIATGRDDEIRALTVNKKTAQFRVEKGVRQYRTLGGAWVTEAAVDAGHKRWGNDTYAQQAALSYEMRKAGTEEEIQHVANEYKNTAKAWGMTDNQAGGAWIGAAFENQNQHLEYKNTDWKTGNMSLDKGRKFVSEIYEKKGSYPLSQMSSNTILKLQDVYKEAQRVGDRDTMSRIYSISDGFVSELATAGGGGGFVMGPGGTPVATAPATGAAGSNTRMVNTPGAAHVAERVRELTSMTGAATDPNVPGSVGAGPAGSHLPSPPSPYGSVGPNRREQR